ncbi:MAG: hypothetical protein PHI31_08185 [Desulfuromonadaceae bacterium]|nr:hypothetical protein [Desulfuromonadaceae bacterium]
MSARHIKSVTLIIILMFLLQPFACFTHPCISCLNHQAFADSSGKAGDHPSTEDPDGCDSTVCCAMFVQTVCEVSLKYAPLVTVDVAFIRYPKLPTVVLPIFIPPQNCA